MEQFSPKKSKIFTAAAFANFYSSPLLRIIRTVAGTILLLLLLVSSTNQITNLTYLVTSLVIVFFIFEVFYRAKILKEKPIFLAENRGNLADSFTLEAAKLLIGVNNVNSFRKLFSALLKNEKVRFLITKADLTRNDLNKVLSVESQQVDFNQAVQQALSWTKRENRQFIDKLDILLALVSQNEEFKRLLFDKQLKESDLLNIVFWARTQVEKDQTPFWERSVETLGPGISDLWEGGWTLETERYSFDITRQMQKGKMAAALVGKDKEIKLVEEVLSRSDKRNIILLGPPGIGKTTIVYGLAQKSIQGTLPEALKYKRFLEMDVTSLLAGAAAGEIEERIQNLLTEISHAGNVVLFIPNIENLAGSSGTKTNITGHLLSALGAGNLQVIATSTHEAFRRYIETQGTFAESFEKIDLAEPGREEAIKILEEASPKIERENKVIITYKALQVIVDLSNKYLVDRSLPGKAIDLLDEVSAATSLKQKKLLEPSDVEETLSQKTKIPIGKASKQEAEGLLNLENVLHERIIDQNEAIVAVANALRRARTIERQTKKPIGCFLFLGPTGVGKTETAKALAALYFKSEDSIIRIDMSEFQNASDINRLIGAPPGTGEYEEGGELTEKVRQNPYSLILLDEMEKAHQKIQEAFLPVFDEGVLQDATGRKIVFTNTIIIATSNAGAEFIRESIQKGIEMNILKTQLLEGLQREGIFKPEFLNRFDDIIVYKPLTGEEVGQVVSLLVDDLALRLKKQDVYLKVDPNALIAIAQAGYDPTYGARPLRRYIADNLEEKIAEKILSDEIKRGSQVTVSISNNQLLIK